MARALELCSEAAPLLHDRPALRARHALTRCEVLALRCRVDEAETQLAELRPLLSHAAVDPWAQADAFLAEALVAKARGQRSRELDAYARNTACLAGAGDAKRKGIAQAWATYENTFGLPEVGDDIAVSPAAPDPACSALLYAARGLRLSRRDPKHAAQLFLRASEMAQGMGMVRHAVVCTLNAGAALQSLGDLAQAATCFEAATELARPSGWPVLVGACGTQLGALLLELGRLEESRCVLSAAVETLSATPTGINKANACSALAQTLLRMGRGIESLGPMSEAIRMYREAKSVDNLAQNLIGHARGLSAAGQPEMAMAALDEVRMLIERHGFSALTVAVCEALAEIHLRHPSLPAPSGMTMASSALHYAEAMLHEGQKLEGWSPSAALLVQLSDCWAAAGDMGQAYGYARKALVLKDQEAAMKSGLLSSVVPGWSANRHGAARTDSTSSGAGIVAASTKLLSPKEREVLQLLTRNLSNKEIAKTLDIGEETVKWHLKKVFIKLGAGSRKHAVMRAQTLGVISFST